MANPQEEKSFSLLCEIVRAQHFAWREAVRQLCPSVNPAAVVDRMWELTGHQTARAYLKRIAPSEPLAEQVARAIVRSSVSMGEDAVVEVAGDPEMGGREGFSESPDTGPSRTDEAFVRHVACPWFGWHARRDLLEEDRRGCDVWLRTVVDAVNGALGTKLRIETLETLPEGGCSCLRRLWVER